MNKANFFIVGMPRSGTTSLYTYLKQHPEIYLALYKEPHFFGKDLTRNIYCIRDKDMYDSLFARAGDKKCIGEASVWYHYSRTAAAEIKTFNPDAGIIFMLRNPIDMIDSLHSLYTRTGNEDAADFQEALRIQPERMKGLRIPESCYFPEGLLYTEVAAYYEKIKRFVDVFGMSRIHFVIFDDFAADTARCYREVLEFLEVDADFRAELDLKKAAAVIRPIVLDQIRHAHPVVREILARKTGNNSHMGSARPPLAPELRTQLKKQFRQDIEKTSRFIERDLGHWIEI